MSKDFRGERVIFSLIQLLGIDFPVIYNMSLTLSCSKTAQGYYLTDHAYC